MIFSFLFITAAVCEMMGLSAVMFIPLGLAGLEGIGYANRFLSRGHIYKLANERAKQIHRPIVVIGAPGAATGGYPCGDLCVDLDGCERCGSPPIDAKHIPVKDDSVVVFVSCTLGLIPDIRAAWKEILRIAGSVDNVFVVDIQEWTLTASAYPGTKWIIESAPPFANDITYRPATDMREIVDR